jgi:hypothetical protein
MFSCLNFPTDLRFLLDFPKLTTLIVDRNGITSQIKLPLMIYLETLWVNHNKISNLSKSCVI